MKIIGEAADRLYLCEIDHAELKKFLGTFYGRTKRLKTGDEVDLAQGYNYLDDIRTALAESKKFIEIHQPVIQALTSGLSMLTNIKEKK